MLFYLDFGIKPKEIIGFIIIFEIFATVLSKFNDMFVLNEIIVNKTDFLQMFAMITNEMNE